MQWEEIRKNYPNRWMLVEAINAYSEVNKRILKQLSVLEAFYDSESAIKNYAQLNRESPERELYVFHTSREILEVSERRWVGIRGIQ